MVVLAVPGDPGCVKAGSSRCKEDGESREVRATEEEGIESRLEAQSASDVSWRVRHRGSELESTERSRPDNCSQTADPRDGGSANPTIKAPRNPQSFDLERFDVSTRSARSRSMNRVLVVAVARHAPFACSEQRQSL
jgi:hypothetical protein